MADVITLRVGDELLERVDEVTEESSHSTRSELIRQATRKELLAHEVAARANDGTTEALRDLRAALAAVDRGDALRALMLVDDAESKLVGELTAPESELVDVERPHLEPPTPEEGR